MYVSFGIVSIYYLHFYHHHTFIIIISHPLINLVYVFQFFFCFHFVYNVILLLFFVCVICEWMWWCFLWTKNFNFVFNSDDKCVRTVNTFIEIHRITLFADEPFFSLFCFAFLYLLSSKGKIVMFQKKEKK